MIRRPENYTDVVRPRDDGRESTSPELSDASTMSGATVSTLEISRGDRPLGEYPLPELTTLGRSPTNTVVLDDPSVSRVHALVFERDGRLWIQDAGSKNGVRFNGQRATRAVLQPGDAFDIGEFRCVVRAGEPARVEARPGDATETRRTKNRSLDRWNAGFVGGSEATRKLLELVRKVARTRVNVLITGESGSGKGVVARLLHTFSQRAAGPFVLTNCSALPAELVESELFGHRRGSFTGATEDRAGKFQAADRGTLFLDEIGDTSLAAQAKLLHAIEEREIVQIGNPQPIRVDVRVVAATNRDLTSSVAGGEFREDLYFRLATMPLHVPPLRERSEDIALLANSFLEELVAEITSAVGSCFTPDAIDALVRYPWPGNVRQLKSVVTQAVITKGQPEIRAEDLQLPTASRPNGEPPAPTASLEENEVRHIIAVLDHQQGNITRAARVLRIQAKTLRAKLVRYGIERGS